MLLALPGALRAQLLAEAHAAYPKECCGLIEGVRHADGIEVLALHPARNLAAGNDRFEIDPTEHIGLLKRLRGSGREIVGCYHSHPGGTAEPSETDRAGAGEDGFVWLIVAIDAEGDATLGAHLFRAGAFEGLACDAFQERPAR